jgi:integrase
VQRSKGFCSEKSNENAEETAANVVEALRALCLWAKRRGYLAENPLENMQGFDTTPQTTRRALTADEIRRLLDAAPERHRLPYETALGSGLRAGTTGALGRDRRKLGRVLVVRPS